MNTNYKTAITFKRDVLGKINASIGKLPVTGSEIFKCDKDNTHQIGKESIYELRIVKYLGKSQFRASPHATCLINSRNNCL